MELRDVIDIAIKRADAYVDLWKFYALFVGSSFTVATFDMSSHERSNIFAVALPIIFLFCALANLIGIIRIGRQRKAILALALELSPSDKVKIVLKTLDPGDLLQVILVHVIMDMGIAVLISMLLCGKI